MSDDNLSDADKSLFRENMKSVTPLKPQTPRQGREPAPNSISLRRLPHLLPQSIEPLEYSLSNQYSQIVQADTVLSYNGAKLPRKRFLQLKTGAIPFQAQLDLHGMHLSESQHQLCRFIIEQCDLGHRCVLIIHGKGSRYGEPPVLKNHLNAWLPQLPQVLAFHSAINAHGGRGAVYVLLKKQ